MRTTTRYLITYDSPYGRYPEAINDYDKAVRRYRYCANVLPEANVRLERETVTVEDITEAARSRRRHEKRAAAVVPGCGTRRPYHLGAWE